MEYDEKKRSSLYVLYCAVLSKRSSRRAITLIKSKRTTATATAAHRGRFAMAARARRLLYERHDEVITLSTDRQRALGQRASAALYVCVCVGLRSTRRPISTFLHLIKCNIARATRASKRARSRACRRKSQCHVVGRRVGRSVDRCGCGCGYCY